MSEVKDPFYADLLSQARGLLSDETDRIANAANLSALLFQYLERVNWVGFYFANQGQLLVGPFCGKPACTRIPIGKGVCGTAFARGETIRVDDVHAFEGHIACDIESRSELVIPLQRDGVKLGVLDIDSPVVARFTATDQRGLEQIAAVYLESVS